MERDERYEVNGAGKLIVGTPCTLTPTQRKELIQKMFSINGWNYSLIEEVSQSHFVIKLSNSNLEIEQEFHLYHGNVRKEDPERNREEKKIQLGTDNDPRDYMDSAIIMGFYISEQKDSYSLEDIIISTWPIERDKNYPANPSLRVNMRTDVLPAKNTGFYVDKLSGKNLVVFRPEFIYHYINNYKNLQYSNSTVATINNLADERISGGTNVLLYGVPGSGKSWTIEHEYCKPGSIVQRLVFHPDYTYADFVGQILPAVDENGQVTYEFTPGPFTQILREAQNNPNKEYILIIEEINRGNAPSIFGEVFQLLDRKVEVRDPDDGLPIGTSEYSITNAYVANEVFGKDRADDKVRIPSNLSIIGTMNTSDQNVFTLDTAFQRRWDMRLIENDFENVRSDLADAKILDTDVSWKVFCDSINDIIIGNSARMTSSEDKRLGAYFVHLRDLQFDSKMGNLSDQTYDSLRKKESTKTITESEKETLAEIRSAMMQNRKFPEKVIKYLWDDAFKFNREAIFEVSDYQSLEKIIKAFLYSTGNERFRVFQENVRNAFFGNE